MQISIRKSSLSFLDQAEIQFKGSSCFFDSHFIRMESRHVGNRLLSSSRYAADLHFLRLCLLFGFDVAAAAARLRFLLSFRFFDFQSANVDVFVRCLLTEKLNISWVNMVFSDLHISNLNYCAVQSIYN